MFDHAWSASVAWLTRWQSTSESSVFQSASTTVDHNTPSYRFSITGLIVNAIVASLMVVLVWHWSQYRYRAIAHASDRDRTRRRFDLATAAACLLIPAGLTSVSAMRTIRHQQLGNAIGSSGAFQMAAELPNAIADRIPKRFLFGLRRLNAISITTTDGEVVKRLAGIHTIRTLRCRSRSNDWQWLDELAKMPQLNSLSLSYCRLGNDCHKRISRCVNLRKLSLYGTPLSEQDLRCYDNLHQLESVDLRESGIRLASLGQPKWRHSIHSLNLPRPKSGVADHLSLDGWPQLESLRVQRRVAEWNNATLTISLRSLPRLVSLHLDRIQAHAIKAHSLPRLTKIDDSLDQWIIEAIEGVNILGQMWVRSLDLEDLPRLTTLNLSAGELSLLRLRNVDQLNSLSLGSFRIGYLGYYELQPCKAGRPQDFLAEIVNIPSLEELDLSSLPLKDSDLSLLTELTQLKKLNLAFTGIDASRLDWMDHMTNLIDLDLGRCQIRSQQLNRWVASLPKLKSLQADLSDIDRLEISGNQRLSSLRVSNLPSVRHVEVRNAIRLSGSLHLGGDIESLDISNCPRLTGLSITSPWLKAFSIENVPGLNRFAAGGPELNEAIVQQIISGQVMDELSLAYCPLSPSFLSDLKTQKQLTLLALPGCGIDDQVSASWREMDRLRSVCLDDNQLGPETFRWLSGIESLRHLSIKRVPIDQTSWRQLRHIRQVSRIDLSKTKVDAEGLRDMMSEGNIEWLDLSGVEITDAIHNVIATSHGLRVLILNDSDLTESQIQAWVHLQPQLMIQRSNQDLISAAQPSSMRKRRGHRNQSSPTMRRGGGPNPNLSSAAIKLGIDQTQFGFLSVSNFRNQLSPSQSQDGFSVERGFVKPVSVSSFNDASNTNAADTPLERFRQLALPVPTTESPQSPTSN
ncbi:MAG: hypothetical protein AAF745_07715 [Planctomycetota bacterium]